MLPVLCLGEQLPTSVGMKRGTLSTERRHRAQALSGFHSSLPCFFHLIFLFLRRSHYDYDSELILVFREPISDSMAHFARLTFVSSRHRASFNELFRLAVLFLNRNALVSRQRSS
jgi:hypothetical protein